MILFLNKGFTDTGFNALISNYLNNKRNNFEMQPTASFYQTTIKETSDLLLWLQRHYL